VIWGDDDGSGLILFFTLTVNKAGFQQTAVGEGKTFEDNKM
jgi:hypothetical protein